MVRRYQLDSNSVVGNGCLWTPITVKYNRLIDYREKAVLNMQLVT